LCAHLQVELGADLSNSTKGIEGRRCDGTSSLLIEIVLMVIDSKNCIVLVDKVFSTSFFSSSSPSHIVLYTSIYIHLHFMFLTLTSRVLRCVLHSLMLFRPLLHRE